MQRGSASRFALRSLFASCGIFRREVPVPPRIPCVYGLEAGGRRRMWSIGIRVPFAHMTQSAVKSHNGPADRLHRSAGPAVNPSRSAPACRRRLRLSLISADTVLSARTPFLRRGSPSLSRRMRRAPRAQRNRGYPRRPPGSPGRGLWSIPLPPGTSCRGPRATSRARPRWPRWPSPRACRGRASPRAAAGAARTPSSRASLSRGARPYPLA